MKSKELARELLALAGKLVEGAWEPKNHSSYYKLPKGEKQKIEHAIHNLFPEWHSLDVFVYEKTHHAGDDPKGSFSIIMKPFGRSFLSKHQASIVQKVSAILSKYGHVSVEKQMHDGDLTFVVDTEEDHGIAAAKPTGTAKVTIWARERAFKKGPAELGVQKDEQYVFLQQRDLHASSIEWNASFSGDLYTYLRLHGNLTVQITKAGPVGSGSYQDLELTIK